MKRVCRNEVDISEIFYFAKEKFGKEWNACCDLFQGGHEILPFIGVKEFYLEELEYNLKDVNEEIAKGEDVESNEECKLAYEILIAYMKENKVKTMYYVGTGN